MKLIAVRRDGRKETINLTNPAVIERHGDSPLWLIRCDSLDHYFTLDGHYDGWGINVEGHDLSQPEAATLIEAVEAARKVDD